MGLAWINPLYLAGMLLLALPVIIHLVQKQHASGIKFPSLMFLQKIQLQQKRRLVIRHWILLLLRCLLLLLLILAFARPFYEQAFVPDDGGSAQRDSVIVIDRSYSMGVADHWSQAQAAALEFIDSRGPRDRIGLVWFDDEVEVASDLTTDAASLRAVVARAQPGLRGTRLRIALEQADRLLAGSSAAEKRILLVSDFRAAAARSEVPVVTAGIEIELHPIEVAAVANSGILSIETGPTERAVSDEFRLRVDLVNYADEPLQQQLSVELDGREIERRPVLLEPGQIRSESFDRLAVAGGLARGRVSLAADALELDNTSYFVFSTRHRIPVLVVEPQAARENQSLFVENALGLAREPAFRVRVSSWEQLDPDDLRRWGVIVVNDAPLPGGAMAAALRDFVAAGGGLLVAVGEETAGNWPGGDSGFLPGRLLRRVDAEAGGAFRITGRADHPVLGELDLAAASVFSFRGIEAGAADRLLASYDDGSAFLLERGHGSGKILVMNTTLDPHWNTLALQPFFLPLLHRGLSYLSTYEAYPQSVAVGEIVDVMRYARALVGSDAIVAAGGSAAITVESPGGAEIGLARERPLLEIAQRGFYQVHRATPASTEVVLAANIDPAEAGLGKLDLNRFVEDIRKLARPPEGERLSARRVESQEQQQQLWYAILSLALILMLVEAFAANWTAVRRVGT